MLNEHQVVGVAIGFFMKLASELRITTFDISLKSADSDEWATVISRKESSGAIGIIETFPFSARTALYVRFESHGNSFNNWTALTEIEICGKAAEESNALFGDIKEALDHELQVSANEVCSSTTKIAPHMVSQRSTVNSQRGFGGGGESHVNVKITTAQPKRTTAM